MNMLESSVSIGPESKHFKMKQLVNAIQMYFQTKREDTAMVINMHLQSLSVTIDLSVFDPHSNIAPQFFVSLYELMNKMEVRSPFAWNCVDVLTNVCRNPAARHALIHTYQFIPSLSRLLSDQMSIEKKIRLLRLMQDLTCGIKISWQIPHLPHLMVTLSDWIESSHDEIITLSMGILVNLCYKNLPAIYTLMGNVDVKKILQICSTMRGPTIEIHTCKLLIILDYMNGDIPESILLKVVNVTFESVIEAFRIRDSILLRQITEFFLDVGKQNSLEFLAHNESYYQQISQLIEVVSIIQNNHSMETGDSNIENRDPECIALVFEFLNFLIEIKLAAIGQMFPVLIQVALKWIHTDLVSSQALGLLKSIAVNVDRNDNGILEPLIQGLPIFLTTIDTSRNEDGPDYIEQNLKIAGLLQLLKIMVQVPTVRPKILEELKLGTICKVFGSLQDVDGAPKVRTNDLDMGNIETINLYIHGVALVNELAKHDVTWMNLQSNLMQHKQTHMILAQCLCQSSKEEKSIVLEMSAIPCFPRKMVAEIMVSLQAVSVPDLKRSSSQSVQDLNFPVLSVTQIKKIDTLLTKLRETFAQKQFSSILTSDVIELYEYKLASMGNAERAAMASVEAASERCTHLQHRNAQLTSELNRSHQLLYHVQQCHEQVAKIKDNLTENVDALKKQVDVDKGKLRACKSQLGLKEDELNEVKKEFEDFRKKHEKIVDGKKQVEDQNAKLKQLIAKLEENSTRLEKVVQKKEEALKKSNYTVDSLNLKINELESNLTQKQGELQQTMVELKDVTRELNTRKQILETITKFALNSQISEQ
ncbi:CIP2A, partial [Asbolus verrucosus]